MRASSSSFDSSVSCCVSLTHLYFSFLSPFFRLKFSLVAMANVAVASVWAHKLSNYSSMEGVLYCKPHFEQLYKESGNFNKNFLSPAKSADQMTPVLTKSPSKAAGMFSGHKINVLPACCTLPSTAVPTYRCKSTVVAKIHQPIHLAKNSTANLVKRHYMSRGAVGVILGV
ncbi:hypothetical protein POM88_048461 [Heracleum sosnowskyi]|uniref:Uncharacterized protein n=1 Tax=Heracleum sosnowskyi TaxID=360622 RepID=A0AAD8GTV3_9APIA|nr:hypothetical protein POM88_048461 [Heracleum sosnowskyi]